jgi:hypothetical protein
VSADLALRDAPSLRARSRGVFASPPGWLFHLLCVPLALVRLWSASFPGYPLLGLFAEVVLVALAGWWLLRLIVHVRLRGNRRRRFGVAPACALVFVLLLAVQAPLQVRWHLREGDFNRVVASLNTTAGTPIAGEGFVEVPHRIGGYSITSADRVPGGLIFYESHGSIFNDAGFGWFPAGPDAEALEDGTFENPQFTHLHGPWYAWTASW